MKARILLLLFGLTVKIYAQNQAASGASSPPLPINSASVEISPYTVTELGANHRVWQRVTVQTNILGAAIYRTNSYRELATGMHYWNGWQWVDSSDQIQLTQNGAAATNGQHQVSFAANVNTAVAIDLATPDGKNLQSHVLGLAYFDSATSNSVMFAELQDSIGQLLQSSNQVIYTNAFTDVQADVLYTYKKNGMEQDIILRQQPPSPTNYGLNPQTTRLQIWTEFVNPPEPIIITNRVPAPMASQQGQGRLYLTDSKLDFGVMKIGRGNASSLGGNTNAGVLAPIAKRWVHIDGRTFLIEEVYLNSVAAQLQVLPPPSSSQTNSSGGSGGQGASLRLRLPLPRQQVRSGQPMHLAKLDTGRQSGLLLDYQIVNGSLTNYTFQSDTTYYISGESDFYDTTTIEGGTVIKCGVVGGDVIVIDGLLCQTGPYRPGILTCTNDNSVGVAISGSSGTPTLGITTYLVTTSDTGTCTISNLFFRYAWNGYSGAAEDVEIWNCQFVDCSNPITVNSETATLGVHNILITMDDSINNTSDLDDLQPGAFVIYSSAVNVYGEHVTADLGSQALILYDIYSDYYTNGTSFAFTNSILLTPNLNPIYQYGSPPAMTVSTNTSLYASSLPTNLFQTVGAGNYYLANGSPYHNAGTTNVTPALLTDLANKTTYPPVVLSNITVSESTVLDQEAPRDNFGAPDIGYHYDPLDFIVDDFGVTNAPLILTNGVAIACYTDPEGIVLYDGSSIVSVGSPVNPNWFTTYQMVQEQSITIGAGTTPLYFDPYYVGSIAPNGLFQFCKFSGGGTVFDEIDYQWAFNNLLIEECEFYADLLTLYGSTNSEATTVLDNNLFARTGPYIEPATEANFAFSNNLVWCAAMKFKNPFGEANCYAFNNVFDTCSIAQGSDESVTSNGYNAYLNCGTNRLEPTNAFDIVSSNSLVYQTGPLGDFYQPADSPLLNEGSTNASLVGLYEYTTHTNQVKQSNSIVDIGYHYVAVDTNGNPDSTLWLGIPDYLVDTNGDGATNLVAWQLEYFGYTGLNPYADPYNQGTNLLQDYESGADLTQISFYLSSTNNYVATNLVPITVNVSGGIPYYMALLVDNTNIASATWTNYASNLMVNLGTNQGWHQVWVGVSALPTNALPLWQMIRLNLDLTPPQIVITSPTNSTTFLPEIQVLGYSPEPLASLCYDVTNAAGSLSNQLAYVSSQFYDTNIYAFTTNFFQLYDIDLTNGVNTIFIHATDRAGNTTTTNVSFTFDLSGDTNAPVITLFWPQNNGQVSGTNFTLRGSVDNPTAFVTAQLVDTNGCTNAFNGIVERNGNFWVENLPLASGTNVVTLVATDAATNSSTTNINVISSSLQLSIDAIEDGQLSNAPVEVTGEINSTNYTVWVNGVQATLSGDSWSASSVPFNSGGTAVIEARAIPNTDNGGYGTTNLNSGNPSVADPGNPSSGGAVDATLQPVIAPYVTVTSYDYMSMLAFAPTTVAAWPNSTTVTTEWTTNGGSYNEVQVDENGAFTVYDQITYAASSYPPSAPGNETFWNTTGTSNTDTTAPLSIPFPWWHMGDGQVDTLVSGTNQTQAYVLYNADTRIELVTGGKGASHRQDLFAISGSATPMIWHLFGGIGGLVSGPTNVSPTSITMGSLGQLGTDGIRWLVMEENMTVDATPTVAGVQNYSFTAGATPYMYSITANGVNLSTNTPKFCVGQLVTFSLNWSSSPPNVADTLQGWTLPGNYVNQAETYSDEEDGVPCTNYVIIGSLLGENPTYCWYVDQPGGQVAVWQSLHFTNGQYATVVATGNIIVFRPKVVFPYSTNRTLAPMFINPWLQCGDGGSSGTADFDVVIYSQAAITAVANWTQLISRTASYPHNSGSGLDTSTFYNSSNSSIYRHLGPTANPDPWGRVPFFDCPGLNVDWLGIQWNTTVTGSFQTYLEFKPDGTGSIWVTLGIVTWGWGGTETSGTLTSSNSTQPTYTNSSQFPLWTTTPSFH